MLIERVVYFLMTLGALALGPLFLVIGGILFMSQGFYEPLREIGKRIVRGTLLGILFVFIAFIIVNTVIFVLQAKGVGGFGTGISCDFKTLALITGEGSDSGGSPSAGIIDALPAGDGSPAWRALHDDPNGFFVSDYAKNGGQGEDFAETFRICYLTNCDASKIGLSPSETAALQKKFDYLKSSGAVCL